jgi:[CysO sulfur-carrier protein]-thiocarboxylate-dependent cysteine synthase
MDALDLVGRTPLIELRHCSPRPEVRLFAKLEGQNPTGSIKDRVVSFLVKAARDEGALHPGQEIIEASTGNTGIALAAAGRRLGHPVRVVVPEAVYPGVIPALGALEARVVRSSAGLGMRSAVDLARELAEREGAYFLDQFDSPANPTCHYQTTAVEILDDCPSVGVFVCGVGTGGTITGVGRRLREVQPNVRLLAAEPHPGEQLQGLHSMADGFLPPILDLTLLNGKIVVSAQSAFRAVREIGLREGLLVGPSSGAVMHAALKWAQRLERATMVLMFADSGWKYLGSPMLTQGDTSDSDEILWW